MTSASTRSSTSSKSTRLSALTPGLALVLAVARPPARSLGCLLLRSFAAHAIAITALAALALALVVAALSGERAGRLHEPESVLGFVSFLLRCTIGSQSTSPRGCAMRRPFFSFKCLPQPKTLIPIASSRGTRTSARNSCVPCPPRTQNTLAPAGAAVGYRADYRPGCHGRFPPACRRFGRPGKSSRVKEARACS